MFVEYSLRNQFSINNYISINALSMIIMIQFTLNLVNLVLSTDFEKQTRESS